MQGQLQDVIARFAFLSFLRMQPGLLERELRQRCCESMYMDYFSYCQIREEMVEKGLAAASRRKQEVRRDTDGRELSRWDLTPAGEALLVRLQPSMPDGVLRYLHRAGDGNRDAAEGEAAARVERTGTGEYWAVLQIVERGVPRFETRFSTPDEALARRMSERWKQEAPRLYPQLLQSLLTLLQPPAGPEEAEARTQAAPAPETEPEHPQPSDTPPPETV